jgi:chromosome segregation ATPase
VESELWSPELLQAAGAAIATVIGAVTAWQAREVSKLRSRVESLEAQLESDQRRFRDAIRLIRALQHHIDELLIFLRIHVPGEEPPTATYRVPESLEREI